MNHKTLFMKLYESGEIPDRIKIGVYDWQLHSAGRFLQSPPPPTQFLVENYIARKICTAVYGPGGCGKSLFVLDLSIRVAIANIVTTKWLGEFNVETGGKVIYISAEEPEEILWERVYHMTRNIADEIGMTFDTLKPIVDENIIIVNLSDKPKSFFALKDNEFLLLEEFKRLYLSCEEYKPTLIVIDTRSRLTALDENNNVLTAKEVSHIESLARAAKGNAIIIHHSTKGSRSGEANPLTAARGASSFYDNVKCAIYLQPMADPEGGKIIQVHNSKNNYMAEGAPVFIKIQSGFKLEAKINPKVQAKDIELSKDIDVVVDFVFQNPGLGKSDIYNAMKTKEGNQGLLSFAKGIKAVKAAIDMGILEEIPEGKKKTIVLGKNYHQKPIPEPNHDGVLSDLISNVPSDKSKDTDIDDDVDFLEESVNSGSGDQPKTNPKPGTDSEDELNL